MVEFLVLGTLLLLPVVYLVLTLGRLQAAAYAVDSATRAAARAYTTAPDEARAGPRARAAVRLALLDQGFDAAPDAVTTVSCAQRPCLTPDGRVTVQVTLPVTLPGIPALLDRVVPTRVRVRSSSTATVDAFRPIGGTG